VNDKKCAQKNHNLNSKIKNRTIGLFLLLLCWNQTIAQLPKYHGKVQTKLFLSESSDQPLVVFFGGSEGGMYGRGITKKFLGLNSPAKVMRYSPLDILG
jgi:hypothetical protein